MELLSCASTLVTDLVDAGCREVDFSEVQLDRFEVLGCVCRVQAVRDALDVQWMCNRLLISLFCGGVNKSNYTDPTSLRYQIVKPPFYRHANKPQIELTVSHAFFNFNTLPFDMSADDYARRH